MCHTELIIWDEASMSHRYVIEALNRPFKDIWNNDSDFDGVSIVFGGEF